MVRKDDANTPAPPKVDIIANPSEVQPQAPVAVAMKEPESHVPLCFNFTPIVLNMYTFMLITMPNNVIIAIESAKLPYASGGTSNASRGEKKRYSSNTLKMTKKLADTAIAIPMYSFFEKTMCITFTLFI